MLPVLRHLSIVAFAGCLSVIVYLRMKRKWAARERALIRLRDMKN